MPAKTDLECASRLSVVRRVLARLTSRAAARERGTIIVLALAVLAVLALAAVSYVSVVRLDRRSSAAIANVRDYQRQTKAVVGHMGALLTADLFGNKIVTRDVPEFGTQDMPGLNNVRIWPKMFEDGETWDTPTVDEVWREIDDVDQAEELNADPFVLRPTSAWGADPGIGGSNSVARPDDAWLASSEPNWWDNPYVGDDVGDTFEWKQISNLRSAYTWGRNRDTGDYEWRRGDGKFVNLASYFDAPNLRDGRADMGLDLFHVDNGGDYDTLFAIDGLGDGRTRDTNPTRVFHVQIDELWNEITATPQPPRLTPADEAEWVDTDGDLRADARWTKLDALGDLYGLNWFVAARIVDASALMNINASIEAPWLDIPGWSSPSPNSPADREVVFDGRTPADVDLYRLLGYDYEIQAPLNNTFFRPLNFINYRGGGVGHAFADHVDLGLNMLAVIDDLQDDAGYRDHERLGQASSGSMLAGHHAYRAWLPVQATSGYEPMTRAQRLSWWEHAGSSPREAVLATSNAYPVRELIDLRTFWGTNNTSMVSKIEQYIDGPDADGFLPTLTPPANEQYGPMRARERGESSRAFADDKPSRLAIFKDVRRHLTPVSGVGNFSPVPPINRTRISGAINKFEDDYINRKVSLPELKRDADAGTVTEEDARRVFENFVWALAPLATTTSLGPDLPNPATDATLDNQQFHYGGGVASGNIGAAGYAKALGDPDGSNIGPAYALLRAGAMTVNLIDAMDRDPGALAATPVPEKPTVLRFYPEPANNFIAGSQDAAQDELRVNGRFIHGDLSNLGGLPGGGIPAKFLGGPGGGVSFVGLDRQPFLREVHFFAAYQNVEPNVGPGVSDGSVRIDPTDDSQKLGSLIAVELGNPWPDAINVAPYRVRLQEPDGRSFALHLDQIEFGTTVIAPGESAVFVWHTATSTAPSSIVAPYPALWDTLVAEWVSSASGTINRLVPDYLTPTGDETAIRVLSGTDPLTPVAFEEFVDDEIMPILLVLDASDSPTGDHLLVDRLWKPGTPFPFGGNGAVDFAGPPGSLAVGDERVVRLTINGNITRPTDTPAGTQEGFPAYVIERSGDNGVTTYVPPPDTAEDQFQVFDQAIANPDDAPGAGFVELAAEPSNGSRRLNQSKGAFTAPAGVAPAFFQLFVPEQTLPYVSDLALLPAFCTMFVHPSAGGVPDINAANVHPLDPAMPLAGAGYWITFAEQMGLDSEMFLDYDGSGTGLANPNPYWGLINPVDFILSDPDRGMGVPYADYGYHDALKVPLGTRIFEPFEALDPKNGRGFIEGRININTATHRVVETTSPMLTPIDDTTSGTVVSLASGDMTQLGVGGSPNPARYRSALLLDYRDVRKSTPFDSSRPRSRFDELGLPIRELPPNVDVVRPGVVNLGELSILASWDRDTLTPGPIGTGGNEYRHMLEVGSDSLNAIGLPFTWWNNDNPSLSNDPANFTGNFAYALAQYDPPDDPEERLAIFRSISNLVSTRSDIFMATFVIRGYNPDRIENIEATAIPEQSMSQSDDQAFEPAYEARFLAVFDRSKVRSPVERPEVLLVVELPLGQ